MPGKSVPLPLFLTRRHVERPLFGECDSDHLAIPRGGWGAKRGAILVLHGATPAVARRSKSAFKLLCSHSGPHWRTAKSSFASRWSAASHRSTLAAVACFAAELDVRKAARLARITAGLRVVVGVSAGAAWEG
jgi:hypothetical protein